jgi:uracil-DNA glycosylase family 4
MTTSSDTSDGVESISKEAYHPKAKCHECPLFTEKGAKYVPGNGPDDADLVVVGEAPGYQEATDGIPFSGPSGKLLDLVLGQHGIDRRDVYVDNVVACRPPSNRTPTAKEVRCCWPRAQHEIAERRPRKILAVGATAAGAVMDSSEAISSLRAGPPKLSPLFPGVEIVSTWHPAFCLRQGDSFPSFVDDVGKLKKSWPPFDPPRFVVYNTPQEALDVIEELGEPQYTRLVIDIEVGIEKDTHFGHPDQYQVLCVGIGYAPNKVVVIGEEAFHDPRVGYALWALLGMEGKAVTCHNGKFDLAGLTAVMPGIPCALGFDTMLASYAVDERQGTHGLKVLAGDLLGAPPYDDEIKPFLDKTKNYANIPRDLLYMYNAYDVACTWALQDIYEEKLVEDGPAVWLHQFLCWVSDSLMQSEMEGVRVDVEHNEKLLLEYLDITNAIEAELRPWVANPRSPKQVKEALHDMGVRVESTDKDHLEIVLKKADPDSELFEFVSTLMKYRKEHKLYSTYIKGIRERIYNGRIHPSFLLHGTTTGRLSSRNPNMQNIPRPSTPSGKLIRAQFIPDEGYIFLQADYAQVELRVTALESQDEYLIGVFNDPSRDIFDEIGTNLYGAEKAKNKEYRARTKAYVYGINYGREAYSIAQEFEIPVAEAQRGMDGYFEMVPGLVRWRAWLQDMILNTDDELETRFGRRRRFHLITRDNKSEVLKQALAFIPQSTASDINLTAMTRLRNMGLRTRIPVHDSILVEAQDTPEQIEVVSRWMTETMVNTAEEVMGTQVPFSVDVTTGYNWGEV